MTRALALAQPGDIVQLLPGTYGSLKISRQSGADNPKVILRGDPNLPSQPHCAQGCTAGNVIVGDVDICGHGLSVRNLDTSGDYVYVYVGARSCPGASTIDSNYNIELLNDHFNAGTLRGHDLLLAGSRIGPNEHICDNGLGSVREDNLHIWPDTRSSPYTAPYNVTLNGNLIYDAVMSTPGCNNAHADLIQTLGYNHLTIENNVFWRPGHSFIQDGLLGGTTIGNAVIRNNFFGGPSAPGGGYTHLGNPDPGPNCTNGPYLIENNTWATGGVHVSCADQVSTFRNNYLLESANTSYTCGAGNWDHNVFNPSGISCGTNARKCRPVWQWPTADTGDFVHGPDLHVAASDTCLRGRGTVGPQSTTESASRDIDGNLRPLRAPVDVGADQRETAQITFGRSIGAVSLGMSRRDIESFYGSTRLRTQRFMPGRPVVSVATYRLHGGSLWVAYSADSVVGVGTTSPYYRTVSGAGVQALAENTAQTLRAKWVGCRSAYIRSARGVITYLKARSKSSAVSGISIVRGFVGAPATCGR